MTGLIPRPFIDDLLSRTDLVEFIDTYVPLKKQGNAYIACCPFHSEKTPSFNVLSKKQFYHCFGCGVSGNAISFAMNYLHQSFPDAVETLAGRVGLTVPREGGSEKGQQTHSLYQFLQTVATYYQNALKKEGQAAITYLKQRQVSGLIAKQYQLGFALSGWHTLQQTFKNNRDALIATGMSIQKEGGETYDRFRNRVMFPIHDRQGRIIGFGGRAIEATQKPKYLNSPETTLFQKSRELYGLYQALQTNSTLDAVVIVEGYMDVIALAQFGVTNAVATLGTATSSYHIQLLAKHTKKIIFCFDGDTAGRQAAWRALENSLPQLNANIDVSFVFLPENHDPDSLIREEGKELFLMRLEKAVPLNQFFLKTLTENLDLKRVAGKNQFLNAAKPYLLKLPEGSYKELLLEEIARLTRLAIDRVQQLLQDKNPLKSNQTTHITRTPLRLAIALLLQNPGLLQQCSLNISTQFLKSSEYEILKKLLEQITLAPHLTTAQLIEAWRESTFFESLSKLATWEHQVPEEALVKEFEDMLLFLSKQPQETVIDDLLKKAQHHGLSAEERLQLQELLKKRHQLC